MEWFDMTMATLLLVFIAVLVVWAGSGVSRLPARFLERGCMGRLWRRRFPNSSKQSIRRFLRHFIDSFHLPVGYELRFSPDDKILDVYRAIYPPNRLVPDELELESFAEKVIEEYGVDPYQGKHEHITLGDVFSRI